MTKTEKKFSPELLAALALGETQEREFKEAEFSGDKMKGDLRDKISNEIAAFANATSGGELYLGVDDEGKICGHTRDQVAACEQAVEEICHDIIKPPLSSYETKVHSAGDEHVLLVRVDASSEVHESKSGVFQRRGRRATKMTAAEVLRLTHDRGVRQHAGYDGQIVQHTGFNSLEEEKWKSVLSVEGLASPPQSLEKIGILRRSRENELCATVAGILLCSRNPEEYLPQAYISAARYRGEDQASSVIDAQKITGPLDEQIVQACKFVSRNMKTAEHKDPMRVNLSEYSRKAVFEAMVNAVAHRDYSITGGHIRLAMFADRLKINSPGALPNGVTIKNMHMQRIERNHVLVDVLSRTPVGFLEGKGNRKHLIESRGDGVSLILRETKALSGVGPKYEMLDESELQLSIPAADVSVRLRKLHIVVQSGGIPVPGADVLVIAPTMLWSRGKTDEAGHVQIDLYSSAVPLTVYVARLGFHAAFRADWDPVEPNMNIMLERHASGGSVIFEGGGGSLPILAGHISPELNDLNQSNMFAFDLSINEGQEQPYHFALNEELRLRDADGTNAIVKVLSMIGSVSLVEYSDA